MAHGCRRSGGFVDQGCTANCDCHITEKIELLTDMTKEAEMLALADRCRKMLNSDGISGITSLLQDCDAALRAATRPAPAAGVIDSEAVINILRGNFGWEGQHGRQVLTNSIELSADAILALKPTMAGEPVAVDHRWFVHYDGFGDYYYDRTERGHIAICYDEDGAARITEMFDAHPTDKPSPAPSGRDPATIEACAKVAEDQKKDFLSPGYASEQPLGSFCERFACDEVARAIRALLTEER